MKQGLEEEQTENLVTNLKVHLGQNEFLTFHQKVTVDTLTI